MDVVARSGTRIYDRDVRLKRIKEEMKVSIWFFATAVGSFKMSAMTPEYCEGLTDWKDGSLSRRFGR